jgi:hypothetical protein
MISLLRRTASGLGGALLSARAYDQLLVQRSRAVSELVELEDAELRPGISGVIFSKDRALQLFTLLRTYIECVENPAPLVVLYDASNEMHAAAYREVEAALADDACISVEFVRELAGFRDSLLAVLRRTDTISIFFLVDDIVFIRPINFSIASGINPRRSILSFRHSPHLRRSYTANVSQLPPRLVPAKIGGELLEFQWFEQGNEWSNPWSVDGHVLSTAEIRVMARLSDFKGPNSFESALKSFDDFARNRRGLCYSESRILNLPINRVQDDVSNLSGNVSPDFLLEQWNKGLMLDTAMFAGHIPQAPHEEHVIRFKSRT